jgi:RimJ/RimL family protein N-acetyltransferase
VKLTANLTRVSGPNLNLRLIELEDADYVYELRTDPSYNRHLSQVRSSADEQRRWIEAYKVRESDVRELYYVIERKDGTRCGVVRIYGIEADCFTWGSWILDKNKPQKAALESAVLVYTIGFDVLGLPEARFEVQRGNEHTLAFHRRFGATETHATEQETHFAYSRDRFLIDRSAYITLLSGK